MALADVFYVNNDVVISLSGLRSSTMSTSSYVTSSTGVTATLWRSTSTGNTAYRVINGRNMPYVSGSNGNYRVIVQSTESTSITPGTIGMAVVRVAHSGLHGEWRPQYRAEYRGEG